MMRKELEVTEMEKETKKRLRTVVERERGREMQCRETDFIAHVLFINSGTPSDLVDGAIYSVELRYEDVAGNIFSTATSTNVGFSGSSTIAPTLLSPVASASLATA